MRSPPGGFGWLGWSVLNRKLRAMLFGEYLLFPCIRPRAVLSTTQGLVASARVVASRQQAGRQKYSKTRDALSLHKHVEVQTQGCFAALTRPLGLAALNRSRGAGIAFGRPIAEAILAERHVGRPSACLGFTAIVEGDRRISARCVLLHQPACHDPRQPCKRGARDWATAEWRGLFGVPATGAAAPTFPREVDPVEWTPVGIE